MKREHGFTLVELLVVIAIIAILAAIVVPNVAKYLGKARATKAKAEINNIGLGLTDMLTGVGRKDFRGWFVGATLSDLEAGTLNYTTVFYKLLRQGRDADVNLAPEVQRKLGTTYMDVPLDPWSNQYQILPGPPPTDDTGAVLLRSYRLIDGENPTADDFEAYAYNSDRYNEAEAERPGNPQPDDGPGFPAPKDLPFYIWSKGENLVSDQPLNSTDEGGEQLGFEGGGDDINNWDTATGWQVLYN